MITNTLIINQYILITLQQSVIIIFLYGQEVDDVNYYNQSQLSIINSMVIKRLLHINKSMEEEITTLKENNDKIIKRLDRIEGVLKSKDRINSKN